MGKTGFEKIKVSIIVGYRYMRPLIKKNYLDSKSRSDQINFLALKLAELNDELTTKIKNDNKLILIIETDNVHGMAEQRRLFFDLINDKSASFS